VRVLDVCPDWSGQPRGYDYSLEVLLFAACRKHKGSLLAVSDRSAQIAFVDSALLGRSGKRKWIASVKMCVTKDEIKGAVILRRARFCCHLDTTATWALIFRRIWILIDLDLFDRRRRDSEIVHLHAVDDERYTVSADTAGIKEA